MLQSFGGSNGLSGSKGVDSHNFVHTNGSNGSHSPLDKPRRPSVRRNYSTVFDDSQSPHLPSPDGHGPGGGDTNTERSRARSAPTTPHRERIRRRSSLRDLDLVDGHMQIRNDLHHHPGEAVHGDHDLGSSISLKATDQLPSHTSSPRAHSLGGNTGGGADGERGMDSRHTTGSPGYSYSTPVS